jgi:methyl-accepting chemotaxis protein
MKIGVKLVVMIGVFNIIGVGLMSVLTLGVSQRETSRLVENYAYSLAVEGGEKIKNWLGMYMDTARSIAQVMEGYQDISAPERREYFDFMLRQTLKANPKLTSIYVNWAPNALDGMDAEYANTPGTDASGRYISGWTYGPNGPYVEAVTGFEWDTILQLGITTDYLFDPFTHTIGGNTIVIANLAAPVKDKEQLVGVIGIVLEISRIQAIAEEIKPFGDGYAFVFSSSGVIAAHPDISRLGKNMQETEIDTFGTSLNTAVNAVTDGKRATFSVPSSKGTIHYYAIPFNIGKNPKPWTLMVGVSRNTVMAPVYRMVAIVIAIGVFTMLLMSAGAILVARSFSRPIAYTMTVLKDIAEGDLTKEIVVNSKDEVGDLARLVNSTVGNIRSLVLAIKKDAGILAEEGTELAANTTETAAAVNEIAVNIQGVKKQVDAQFASVGGTGVAVQRITTGIEALSDKIQKQSEHVSLSSSAVEGMLANIQSVTQTLIANVDNMRRLAESSDIGRGGLREVSGDIQEIARESEGLLEINSVMQNIASQTNLLSMNAAIEAAHAGEAGKGFAVVADEIRKLAESSGEQSRTISGVLKKIKGAIDKITKSTDAVLQKFEGINEDVRQVTEQETIVRDAMEEQGEGSRRILATMGGLQEMTGGVKSGAEAMKGESLAVIKEDETLGRITNEICASMEEMAAGAEQINTAVHHVNDISGRNKEMIETLEAEISRFKV